MLAVDKWIEDADVASCVFRAVLDHVEAVLPNGYGAGNVVICALLAVHGLVDTYGLFPG